MDGELDEGASRSAGLDGKPDPCPLCEGAARLDHIDLRVGAKHQRCLVCGHRWSITVARRPEPVDGAEHAGRFTRTGLADRLAASYAPTRH